MTDPTPPAGTTRYLCPLECGWHHDDPPPSTDDVLRVAPDPDVRSFQEAVSSIVSKAAIRRLEQTEAALKQHLATHTDPAEVAAIEQMLADKGLSGANWRE
ncbi:hypothetical protein TUSST3_09150 [Streptomyces sp. TUS-ST3]|uniref:hypothetical protein n=1 Tax=Streptomyces sp. TUS-ST3 TaxID=3025591 RepID=UPI0024E18908|nr:hypothetical protein [Streptomyces sp. TUS-ST3]GLP64295.1 hypothetical protein TUSST3_09150 [Streptomyces sp. TUS-ST3]